MRPGLAKLSALILNLPLPLQRLNYFGFLCDRPRVLAFFPSWAVIRDGATLLDGGNVGGKHET